MRIVRCFAYEDIYEGTSKIVHTLPIVSSTPIRRQRLLLLLNLGLALKTVFIACMALSNESFEVSTHVQNWVFTAFLNERDTQRRLPQ